MKEVISVITLNAGEGRLFRAKDGLRPVAHADIILFQEVGSAKLAEKRLDDVGLRLVHEDSGLAIAVTDLFVASDERTHLFRRPRIGADRGIIAVKLRVKSDDKDAGTEDPELTAASVHKTVFTRPWVAKDQYEDLTEELSDPYFAGTRVVGGDYNTDPFFMTRHARFLAETGLRSVGVDLPTYMFSGKYRPLKLFREGRIIDDISYGGERVIKVEGVPTKVIETESDHGAVESLFIIAGK